MNKTPSTCRIFMDDSFNLNLKRKYAESRKRVSSAVA
jgi:hypothetical protein